MAYIIEKEECIGCGSCESECPTEAISAESDGKYVIAPEICIDCAACASVCPVEVISPA